MDVHVFSPQQRQNLLSFIGYGSPAGPVWFIGAEEGLGGAMDSDEPLRNLLARGEWPPVLDMRQAHLTLTEKGRPIDISQKRSGNSTVWLWMSRITRAYLGHADWADRESARIYMQTALGLKDRDTFLTELSPVPSATRSNASLIAFRDQHGSEELLADRRSAIRRLLRKERPNLVICYGVAERERYADLLEIPAWKPLSERVWKAEGFNYFLLPFFGNGAISEAIVGGLVNHPAFPRAARSPWGRRS